jgi:PAS domain S-box-containing protein
VTSQPASERPPRLVLRFAIYAAIALLLAGGGIFWFVRHETQVRAEREVAGHATRVAQHLGQMLRPSDFDRPVAPRRREALDEVFRLELSGGLLRIKLWNRDGVVTYSNDGRLIGTKATDRGEIDEALAGGIAQGVASLNAEGGSGANVKTIETYVPVRLSGSRKPAGVLEVYQDFAPIAQEVRHTVTPIGLALVLALLLLYATLLPILRQVTRTLAVRNERLAERTEALGRALDERREAERKLGQAERRYRTLIEQLPLVTYIDNLDDSSSSIYISPQAEELLGYPTLAWLSDPEFFPKVLHPDDRERVLAQHREAFAKGESFTAEYRLVARDGHIVWVQDHVMVARDENERPIHAQGFLLDITERKQAENELAERHSELTALHETAVGLIDELDADKLLGLILQRAGEMVGTDGCYVYLLDDADDELVVRLGTGVFSDWIGYRARKGEGVAGRVWETAEAFAVEDYQTWAGRRPDFDGLPFHAVAGVPLFSRREVVGVIGLAHAKPGRFGEPELALLSRFAHLASMALENARLYSAARASEETFKALVSNVPGAIYRCAMDAAWTMEFLSDAIEQISGYPAGDFIQNRVRTYASIIHPDDAARVEEAVGDGAPYSVEYRILHADGTIRWVFERGQAVHGSRGERWLDGAIFDITGQKAVEEERVKLAAIVESSDDAIMSASPEGVFTSWNAGAEHVFGYTAEEVLGQSISLLAPADRRHEADERLQEVLRSGEVMHVETVRARKDGTIVDVAFTYSPVLDAAGEIVGVSAIGHDIGERKRAEAALAESEAKFRALVETTQEWVWAVDEDGRHTYSNPGVERILGYRPEELLGRDGVELVHEDDRDRVTWLAHDENVRKEGWSGIVLRWRHKDGSYRYVETSATPILDEAGELRGFRGTDRDVTERIRAEEERERMLALERAQNQRLRELDKLKDEFIALVSHELRTPLTSIRGYTELLLDGAAGDLSDDQRQFLGVVERNSQRLLHLVGDLLFLAQIEAGKLALDVGAVDLAAVASESVEAARPAADEKQITLTLATGPVPLLAGDHSRIGQLFDNLVSNAVKFTPSGGRVDVRVRSSRGRAVIEVRDSGIGIPKAERKFLFQRFFRTSTATQQAIQGTGLGLAISKAIVQAHGGSIAVESEEGAGTTFRVSLPIRQQIEGAEPAEAVL